VVVDFMLPRQPSFDLDGDGDVDEGDLVAFTDCLAGPTATPAPPAPLTATDCLAVFDEDEDQDVDNGDFAGFQAAYTGG
jgi:hypothetical protein